MKPSSWRWENTYARLPEAFFRRVRPTPVRAPRLVVFNRALCLELGLDPDAQDAAAWAQILSGNELPPGAEPIAQAYAGHQFGGFTFLGDGRAVILGEHLAPDGRRWDIALKGSGPTPFSRHGDGRAALGPMLREYLISEAMHALGIPTTRSLAVVATGEEVVRDRVLPGAVLTRVASSHIRVGTFQYFWARGEVEHVRLLADYTIARHFPELRNASNPYLAMLQATVATQARLVASWLAVGFIHGVMNTDNMSLAGETIDYGPCAFLDTYRPKAVFSSIDTMGRYAYANQPGIAAWNLARFAETLLPLLALDPEEARGMAQEEIENVIPAFTAAWQAQMAAKLGLIGKEEGDISLIEDWLHLLEASAADLTNAFRFLALDPRPAIAPFTHPQFAPWQQRWQARIHAQPGGEVAARKQMNACNPAVIPRNHLVEEALAAAEVGDLRPLHRLMEVVQTPFVEPADPRFQQPASEELQRTYRTFCGT